MLRNDKKYKFYSLKKVNGKGRTSYFLNALRERKKLQNLLQNIRGQGEKFPSGRERLYFLVQQYIMK